MTLTSLTGALAVSIVCGCVFDGRRSFGVDLRGGVESELADGEMRITRVEIRCALGPSAFP